MTNLVHGPSSSVSTAVNVVGTVQQWYCRFNGVDACYEYRVSWYSILWVQYTAVVSLPKVDDSS